MMTEPDQISDVQALRKTAYEFEETPTSCTLDLKLDLAGIILRQLRRRGWRQDDLARKVGITRERMNQIIHSNVNCSFATIGKILHALGVRATLREKPDA